MKASPLFALGWPRRCVLAAVACGGSTIYAMSFLRGPGNSPWQEAAVAIGIAAGVSWMLFGLVLGVMTRGRPSLLAWADACLVTMSAGIAVKMVTVLANLVTMPAASFHLTVLVIANLTMAAVFIARARRLGLTIATAAALWFVVLNGMFALLLWRLWPEGL